MYGSAVLVSVSLFLPLPRLRTAVTAPLMRLLQEAGARVAVLLVLDERPARKGSVSRA